MKKYLLILLSLTAVLAVSCNKTDSENKKDDPAEKYEYVFYEPVLKWNAGMQEIRSEMSKMADWVENTALSTEDELRYSNKKNSAPDITYSFEDEKMTECTITYLLCNDKFDQMKDDWARTLNLTWKQKEIMGYTVYAAGCRSKECNIIAQQGNISGFDYMTINFQYETIFFD